MRSRRPVGSTVAVIGTRSPSAEATAACIAICRALVAAGYSLATGNAGGIDSIARDVWNETAPEKVTLVLPWPDYNRDKIHPRNNTLVYRGQPDWAKSVSEYHPFPGRLSEAAFKLHARNYGIVSIAGAVVAFPSDGLKAGGTGQGIRIAEALGKPLLIWPWNNLSLALFRTTAGF